MSSGALSVRSALRRVLRAQRLAFANDAPMKAHAVAAIREQFRAHPTVSDAAELDKLVAEAHEAAKFLEENVVQAALNERGNYVVDPAGMDVETSAVVGRK
jgi:complex III assembly factor LYRM7